jgi:hypothetical protein
MPAGYHAPMETLGIRPRRLGAALLAFGAVGVALAIAGSVVLSIAVVSTAGLNDRLEGSRTELVAALERAQTSIGHAADTTENIGSTLDATQATLATSSQTLTALADASDTLANALLAVSILGSQPFAAAGQQFQSLASQVRTYSEHATQLSTSLKQNVTDTQTTATDLRSLQASLGDVATKLDGMEVGTITTALLLGLLLLLALTVWLAVGAIGVAFVGFRIRRRAIEPVALGGPATAPDDGDVTEVIRPAGDQLASPPGPPDPGPGR